MKKRETIPYDDWTRDPPATRPKPKPKISEQLEFKKTEAYCCRVLCDYLRLLEKWRTELAPKMPEMETPLAVARRQIAPPMIETLRVWAALSNGTHYLQKHFKEKIMWSICWTMFF